VRNKGGIPLGKPIVVFGGSFNPPTNAHLALAEQIINDYDVEKVLFMPVGDLYPKKDLIPAEFRVKMLEEVCKENDKFEVSRIEVDSEKCLSTIETLEILRRTYPNQEIWFVLGTDNLSQIHHWDRYEDIVTHFKLLVLERGEDRASDIIENHAVLKCFKHNIIIMKEEVRTNCSSTIVRKRLKKGKGIKYLVPMPVYQYIQTHELYQ
jgi:nicotinate-nucleotide adenylyltransferase